MSVTNGDEQFEYTSFNQYYAATNIESVQT